MVKKCGCCGQEKNTEAFSFNRTRPDGLQDRCKACVSKKRNLARERQYNAQYRSEHRDELLEKKRIYYQAHKETISIQQQRYNKENATKIRARKHKTYLKNKDLVAAKGLAYRQSHKEEIAVRDHKWRQNNRVHINQREYNKKQTDINYMLRCTLRTRLSQAVRKEVKSGSAIANLGCEISDLKLWLEQQFYPNPETGEMMTWQNYGREGWQIDHIIPLAAFDLSDIRQFKKACHWFNLQPLWAKDNYAKIREDRKLIKSLGNEAQILSTPYLR